MTSLFPNYPPKKCRHLIEQIVKAASLINTHAEFAQFLEQEVDLDFLGNILYEFLELEMHVYL